MRALFTKKRIILLVIPLWSVLTALGFYSVLKFAGTPGKTGQPLALWPQNTSITRSSEEFTLLAFISTECSCTQASLSELERLLSALNGQSLSVSIVVSNSSASKNKKFVRSLKERFKSFAAVSIFLDGNGLEARRFGAITSGQTYLYGRDGQLLFRGGITPARGHEGDSLGKEAIIALVLKSKTHTDVAKVFGCSLRQTSNER